MKIIFSRKGFDSGIGGYPSPILPDGRMISLPIPEENGNIKYSALKIQDNLSYFGLMKQLKMSIKIGNKKRMSLNTNCSCHLDPDLRKETIERKEGWKPIFGQVGAAQGHLDNNFIDVGDIFLFFGWFRKTIEKHGIINFDKKDKYGRHIFYGYMQIGEKIKVNDTKKIKKWMKYHPHISHNIIRGSNNTIYIANNILTCNQNLPGAGIFNYNDKLVLTKNGCSRSKWNLPEIFRDVEITYHSKNSWKNKNGDKYFQCVSRGQEFVIDANREILKWTQNIILYGLNKNM